MKDDNGFSLVELIVVIAIMAILTASVGVSIAVLANQRLKSAASDTKSLLQNAQTVAMSKDNCRIEIKTNDDGKVTFTSYSSDSKQISKVVCDDSIKVQLKIGESYCEITDSGYPYELKYVRESGAFQGAIINGVQLDQYCSEIVFTKGEKTVTLKLATMTGKVSYK